MSLGHRPGNVSSRERIPLGRANIRFATTLTVTERRQGELQELTCSTQNGKVVFVEPSCLDDDQRSTFDARRSWGDLDTPGHDTEITVAASGQEDAFSVSGPTIWERRGTSRVYQACRGADRGSCEALQGAFGCRAPYQMGGPWKMREGLGGLER